MAVEFLLVLFFQTEDDLYGTRVHGSLPSRGAENTGGVLEDVGRDSLATDGVFGDTFLVAAHLHDKSGADVAVLMFCTYQAEDLESSFVYFTPTIGNNADDNFLPTLCAPGAGSVATTEVGDILENSEVRYQY